MGLTLVVLAAGMGRRYGGPKQIEAIGPNGEWIIDYSVYDALRCGFDRIVFVVRAEIEAAFRGRFDKALGRPRRVEYVAQSLSDLPPGFTPPPGREKPWGTGHAVWTCREAIDGPFAVINGDDFYGRGAFESLATFLSREAREKAEHALVGFKLANTLTEHGPVTRGVCRIGEGGELREIRERHRVAKRDGIVTSSEDGETWVRLSPDATASMNMWGFGAEFIAELSRQLPAFLVSNEAELETVEFFLPEAVGRVVGEGLARVRVLATDEAWFGVTFPEDVAQARRKMAVRIAAGQYPAKLWGA